MRICHQIFVFSTTILFCSLVFADTHTITFEPDENPSAVVGADATDLYTEFGVRFRSRPTIAGQRVPGTRSTQVLRQGSVSGGPDPLPVRVDCSLLTIEFNTEMNVRAVRLQVLNRHLRFYSVRALSTDDTVVDEHTFFPSGDTPFQPIVFFRDIALHSDPGEPGIARVEVAPPADCFGLAVIDNLSYDTENPITPIEPFGPPVSVYRARDVKLPIKWSGRVNDVSVNPDIRSEVFATTESGGLWVSTSGGEKGTWRPVTSLPVFNLFSVHHVSANPDVIIVTADHDFLNIPLEESSLTTSGGGIWISRDSGATWTKPSNAIPAYGGRTPPRSDRICPSVSTAFGISEDAETGRIFISTSCGISFSDDLTEAGTWSHRFLPFSGTRYVQRIVRTVAALQGNTVIAAGDGGTWRSPDNGNTWLTSTAPSTTDIHGTFGIPGQANTGLLVAGGGTRSLWITQDGGLNWSQIVGTPPGRTGAGGIGHVYASSRTDSGDRGSQIYYGEGLNTHSGRLVFDSSGTASVASWTQLTASHADTRAMAFVPATLTSTTPEPIFLASDGGLDIRRSDGVWEPIGSGDGGINALQLYGVTGQIELPEGDYRLAIGTQDNDLWSSENTLNWPEAQRAFAEGNAISMARSADSARPRERWTYYACGPCSVQMSKPLFESPEIWPGYASQGAGWSFSAPRRVLPDALPGWYVQYLNPNSALRAMGQQQQLAFTPNFGNFYATINTPAPLPVNNPPTTIGTTVYQALSVGNFSDSFQERTVQFRDVHLRRNTIPIFSASRSIDPAMNNFGSLGHYAFQFQWWPVYGVNPSNVMHIIAPDVENKDIKVTIDGGENWTSIPDLKEKITKRGRYNMALPWIVGDFSRSLVSAVSFFPPNPDLVVLGMQMGGAYISEDGGEKWLYVEESDKIPNIVGFDWLSASEIYTASYGRGLWKIENSGRRVSVSLLYDFLTGKEDIPLLRNINVRKLSLVLGNLVSLTDSSSSSSAISNNLIEIEQAIKNDLIDNITLVVDGSITGIDLAQKKDSALMTTPGSTVYEFGQRPLDSYPSVNPSVGVPQIIFRVPQALSEQFKKQWHEELEERTQQKPPRIISEFAKAIGDGSKQVQTDIDNLYAEQGRLANSSEIKVVGVASKDGKLVGPIIGPTVFHTPPPLQSAPEMDSMENQDLVHSGPLLRAYSNVEGGYLGDGIFDQQKEVLVEGFSFEPSTKITLSVDSKLIAEIEVGTDGFFQTTIDLSSLTVGNHVLSAERIDNQNESALYETVIFIKHIDAIRDRK